MGQHDFDKLLQKYLSGTCSDQEEKIVLEWYEKLIAESSLQLSGEEKNKIEQKIWSAVSANIQHPSAETSQGKLVPMQTRILYRVAIAACFILLAGIGAYWLTNYFHGNPYAGFSVPEDYLQLTNSEDLARSIRLSDGSEVRLYPAGSLYYPKNFGGRSRVVYLKGNAFFTISHNPRQHFIVHTEEGLLTEVLGTSFAITHNQQLHRVEVSVVTGKVLVYELAGNTEKNTQTHAVELTPNQKIEYTPTSKQLVASLVEDPQPLLKESAGAGSFDFKETPLSQVVNMLEQTYGITITIENNQLDHCHFTGNITRQGLYEKLDIICQSTQSAYEVKGTEIIMKGKGCN